MVRYLSVRSAAVSFCFLAGVAAEGQKAKTPAERLVSARALYYTPTAQGLLAFHCTAEISWKEFLLSAGSAEVKDDDLSLLYLESVHLGVTDDMHGTGSLEWANIAGPPEGKEAGMAQIQAGTQQMLGGFLRSWNQFMNGSMVPIPDKDTMVTETAKGIHLRAAATGTVVDEDFDKDFLLTGAKVESKELLVTTVPHYSTTADGLLLSSLESKVSQPVTAPPLQVTYNVQYAVADGFRLPSLITLDIKNVVKLDIKLSACKVTRSGASSDDGGLINDKGKAKLKP